MPMELYADGFFLKFNSEIDTDWRASFQLVVFHSTDTPIALVGLHQTHY